MSLKMGFEHRIFHPTLTEQLEAHHERANHLVLLVDDGVATGASVHAAAVYLHSLGFRRVRLCVPIIGREVYEKLYQRRIFEAIHAVEISESFFAVSQAYEVFPQVEWKELASLHSNERPEALPNQTRSDLTFSQKKRDR